MDKIRFTHHIMVPNHKAMIDASKGYAEEMKDVKVFALSQEEYEDLRKDGGLFDTFDSAFGTLIDDCEEDRLSNSQVIKAIQLTRKYLEGNGSNVSSGLDTVLQSLEYAKSKDVFWEIVNGAELCK